MNAQQTARILIIGGGFGGLFTALDVASAGEVTLVSREDHFLFTPMLYEYLSGEVEAWHIAPRYKELLDDRTRFIRGEVVDIDLNKHEATIAGRERRIGYEALVVAVGGVSNFAGVEGAEQFSIPFRTMADADRLRARMVKALSTIAPDATPEDATRAATFALIGAGASGVETATKMADVLRDAFTQRGLPGAPRIVIIEMGERVVPEMDDEIRPYVEQALRDARIEVHTKSKVKRITADAVTFEHNGAETEIKASAVVWTGGVRMNPLIDKLDLEKDKRGLIVVEPTLQARNRPEVFALGDNAFYKDAPKTLAGTAQMAYQEAGLAADNIKAFISGGKLRTKKFEDLGEAVSLGTKNAAVAIGDHAFGGTLARDARFTAYTARLPTWHHRLKVGASWFFEGTQPRPLGLR